MALAMCAMCVYIHGLMQWYLDKGCSNHLGCCYMIALSVCLLLMLRDASSPTMPTMRMVQDLAAVQPQA
jgi:hypothetical protein